MNVKARHVDLSLMCACATIFVLNITAPAFADDGQAMPALKEKLRTLERDLKDKERMIQELNSKRAAIAKELMDLKEAQKEEQPKKTHSIIKEEPLNYEHIETQRVIKLQEENRFMIKRLKDMSERLQQTQTELIGVRNAYQEREDALPRTVNELKEDYEEKIRILEEEIRSLHNEVMIKYEAYEALGAIQLRTQEHLTRVEQDSNAYLVRIKELEGELELHKSRLNENAEAAKGQQKELMKVNEERQKLAQKIEDVTRQLEETNKRNDAQQNNQAQEHERLVKELQERIAFHQQEITRLEEVNKEQLKRNEQLVAQSNEFKDSLSKAAQEKEQSAKEHTNGLEKEKQNFAEKLDDIKGQLTNAENEKKEYQTQIEALNTKGDELGKKISEQQRLLEEFRSKESSFVEKLANLEKALKEKTQALELTQSKQNEAAAQIQQQANELVVKLANANEKVKEFQAKTMELTTQNDLLQQNLVRANEKVGALETAQAEFPPQEQEALRLQIRDLTAKAEELRGKLQEKDLALKETIRENELLLSQLVASKDESIVLNNEVLTIKSEMAALKEAELNSDPDAPSLEAIEAKLSQLTRELLESENKVYEKELVIEDLREEQERIARALDISQENNDLLQKELESLKVNEVSYNERDSVLDLELNKLEERVQQQLRETSTP